VVQSVKPSSKRSISRLLALCAALVLAASGVALWESDWMLERRASHADRVQLRSLAESMPGSAIVQFHLGRRLAAEGLEEPAISALLHAHIIDPGSARITALLSDQLTRQARFREAGALLQSFNARHQHDPQTLYALGVYYYRVYEHTQAVSALQESVKIAPDEVSAWRVLGEAEMALGRYRDAMHAYDVALAREPGHSDTLVRRSAARRMLGDLPGAEQDLRRACKMASGSTIARYQLGELLERSGSGQGTQREAESILRGLEAEPDPMPEVHRELGRVYSGLRNWLGAEREFLAYLSAKPEDPEGLYELARVLQSAGKSDSEIMERYKRAQANQETRKNLLLKVQGDPNNLAARMAQARYLAAHGETAFAILTFERILRQDPNNREAQTALARLRGGM
jgi:tetratricopeptide (TPR) repeat protein